MPASMSRSCRFPYACVDNLGQVASYQPRDFGKASRITRSEPARLAQYAPRPFEPDLLRDRWRPHLGAGDEVERGADAEQTGAIELIDAARREQFLARRAERNEAQLGAGGADAFDRAVGLGRIRIEIGAGRVIARD